MTFVSAASAIDTAGAVDGAAAVAVIDAISTAAAARRLQTNLRNCIFVSLTSAVIGRMIFTAICTGGIGMSSVAGLDAMVVTRTS